MRKIVYMLVSGALVAAWGTSALATNQHDFGGIWAIGRLVGVWHVTGQPVNCTTRVPLPVPAITGIMAFHAGGTSTEAAPSATPRTPGLGTWHWVGKRNFVAAATVLNYDINGLSTGSLVVRRKITLAPDGNSFTSANETTITDASGATFLRCADGTGTRAAE